MFLSRLLCLSLMKLGLQTLVLSLTESLLDELAGLSTLAASKAVGLDPGLTVGSDDDLDGLIQAAPPS